MPESPTKAPFVWIDCEMTGLDVEKDTILSIACFVSDHDLNLVDDGGFEVVIHHDNSVLDQMDEWCREHHGKSGLTSAAIASNVTAEQAADMLLNYIQKHVPRPRSALLAGNTVHQDKAFLRRAPYDRVDQHLNYRILDVSSIKEAARRWASTAVLEKIPSKRGLHEAREDILESIREARYYRDAIFKRGAA